MKFASPHTLDKKQFEDTYLFQMLDNGIADMNAGRELPLADAFQKVTELREHRRNARL